MSPSPDKPTPPDYRKYPYFGIINHYTELTPGTIVGKRYGHMWWRIRVVVPTSSGSSQVARNYDLLDGTGYWGGPEDEPVVSLEDKDVYILNGGWVQFYTDQGYDGEVAYRQKVLRIIMGFEKQMFEAQPAEPFLWEYHSE